MRLLKLINGVVSLTENLAGQHVPYGILSHTWGRDEDEITFKDLKTAWREQKLDIKDSVPCGPDGLEHFWIDTRCI
jgi:hypothetical protein